MLDWLNRTVAKARLGACAAAAALSVGAGAAAAQPAPAFMPLGEQAPAPIAFLSFCARLPGECAPASRHQEEALSAEDMGVDASARTNLSPAPLQTAALAAEAGTTATAEAAAMAVSVDREAGAPASPDLRPWPQAASPLPYTAELLDRLNAVNRRVNHAIKPQTDLKTVGLAERWDLPIAEGMKGGDCEDYVLEKRRALVAEGLPLETLSIAIVVTRWGEAHAVLLVSTDRGELVLDNLQPWVVPWQDESYRWIERQAPGKTFEWVTVRS